MTVRKKVAGSSALSARSVIVGEVIAEPYAPSPQFRAKGRVYLHSKAYCDEHVKGGWAAVQEQLLDAKLRAFTDQLFLASAWYDVLPIVPISEAASRAAGASHKEMLVESARWTARRDMRAIHKVLLTLASVDQVALRLPRVALQYFDFGESDARLLERGAMAMTQRGIPIELSRWMVWAVEGFAPVVLEQAGAKNVRLKLAKPIARDARSGTCAIDWEVRWTDR